MARSRRGRLIYVSYSQGPHVEQIAFSVLSALRFRHRRRPTHFPAITIFADRPPDYAELPVECVTISAEQLQAWRGPFDFNHVVKLAVLRSAIQRYGETCVLIDGDTYFRRDPRRLLKRMGPKRSLMHLRECRLGHVRTPTQTQLVEGLVGTEFTDLAGAPVVINTGFSLWNAGVLGIHPNDARLLDEAIHLTNQIYERTQSHIAEQLAISYFLGRRTRVRATSDVVYHYWPYLREYVAPFGPSDWARRIPELIAASAGMPAEARGKLLMRHAFRPRLWEPGGRLHWRFRPVRVATGRAEPVVRRSV